MVDSFVTNLPPPQHLLFARKTGFSKQTYPRSGILDRSRFGVWGHGGHRWGKLDIPARNNWPSLVKLMLLLLLGSNLLLLLLFM